MPCTSQAQPVVAVGAARSSTGVHNGGNSSGDCTILGPAIRTLPAPHYEIGIKTRVENTRYC